jgi:hypothetical protein
VQSVPAGQNFVKSDRPSRVPGAAEPVKLIGWAALGLQEHGLALQVVQPSGTTMEREHPREARQVDFRVAPCP